jgi:hypothetical protein
MTQTPNSTLNISVRKANGEMEIFDMNKLIRSLRNAGADTPIIEIIKQDIGTWIFDGATTKHIYNRAFRSMRGIKALTAARYRLKQAMLEMGPTGYPFEKLCGHIYKTMGYSVQTGIMVDGCCIRHEMDVIGTKNQEQSLCECKYSVDQGKRIGIQVPLYVKSRVEDIVNKRKTMEEYQGFTFKTWVITNTRFSEDSVEYARCAGINLLSWDFPAGNGLKELIEKNRLFPITVLMNLTKKEKQALLEKGITICQQILDKLHILEELNLSKQKTRKLLIEINDICTIPL